MGDLSMQDVLKRVFYALLVVVLVSLHGCANTNRAKLAVAMDSYSTVVDSLEDIHSAGVISDETTLEVIKYLEYAQIALIQLQIATEAIDSGVLNRTEVEMRKEVIANAWREYESVMENVRLKLREDISNDSS